MSDDPKTPDPSERRRPRRLEDASTEEVRFPLIWIIIGALASLIVIGLIGLGVVNLVRQGAITPTPQSLPPMTEPVEATATIEPTAVAVEPSPMATSATDVDQTETTTETVGSEPATDGTTDDGATTPDETAPAASGSLESGGYAVVINTDGFGLNMRAGPGRDYDVIGLAEESADVQLLLLEGPNVDESGEDYIWWYIQHPDGLEGWVVEDFIAPAP